MSIEEICQKYQISNYTINDDGSIDVDGNVSLSNYVLDKMPLKFNKVVGHFVIAFLGIKTLEGCPEYVGGDFIINLNNILNLKGCPKRIDGSFDCSNNNYLTSLEGGPEYVGGDFICSHNKVNTLKNSPKYIGGDVDVQKTNIENLEGLPKHIKGNLNCSENYLTSLEGGPNKVDGNIYSTFTQLTNLNGFPKCGGKVSLNNNLLTDIKGLDCSDHLSLSDNKLTEKGLEHLPKKLRWLILNKNDIKDLLFLKDIDVKSIKINYNPVNNIIGTMDLTSDYDQITTYITIKPFKEGKLSLKRVKYLWSILFNRMDDEIKKHRIETLYKYYDVVD